MRRCVYYFIHKNRKEERYVIFFLEKLKEISDTVNVVYIEENQYGTSFLTKFIQEGKNNWSDFEKIVFISDDWFGPFNSFLDMFESMEKKESTIWGFEKDVFGNLNPQFMEINSSILQSSDSFDLKDYLMKNADETYVGNIQCRMSKCILEGKLPMVNVGSFISDYETILDIYSGEDTKNTYQFIKDKTTYDTGMIWEFLLKTFNMSDITYNMQLLYVLSKNVSNYKINNKKVALIMHIYYEELVGDCYNYAKNLPPECDVFITTDTDEKIEKIKQTFSIGNFHKVEYIKIENRGRDVSALLVGAKKLVHDYDYLCFTHDKKVKQLKNELTGESFSKKCFDNILASQAYIQNIIQLFENEPKLGMLFAPAPNIGEYYPTLGYFDWGDNYSNVKELYDKLGLTVNISEDKEPIAPLGTMFWFQSKALKGLFDKNWEYDDFPSEPNKNDGTLLHAIERIYPFCVQQEGYYVAWVMNDTYAQTEIINMYFMLKALNKKVFAYFGADTHKNLLNKIDNEENKGDGNRKQLVDSMKEYAKVAQMYKNLSDEYKQSLIETQEMVKLYKDKAEDFEKTLHETQEMVKVLHSLNVQSEERESKLKDENAILTTTINQMKNTKMWKLRSLAKKVVRRK